MSSPLPCTEYRPTSSCWKLPGIATEPTSPDRKGEPKSSRKVGRPVGTCVNEGTIENDGGSEALDGLMVKLGTLEGLSDGLLEREGE